MREKEKKRMWPQSSPAAMGSFTLGAEGAGEGQRGAPLYPDPHLARLACPLASGRVGVGQEEHGSPGSDSALLGDPEREASASVRWDD